MVVVLNRTEGPTAMSSMPENAVLTLPWLVRGRVAASLANADDAAAWLTKTARIERHAF